MLLAPNGRAEVNSRMSVLRGEDLAQSQTLRLRMTHSGLQRGMRTMNSQPLSGVLLLVAMCNAEIRPR